HHSGRFAMFCASSHDFLLLQRCSPAHRLLLMVAQRLLERKKDARRAFLFQLAFALLHRPIGSIWLCCPTDRTVNPSALFPAPMCRNCMECAISIQLPSLLSNLPLAFVMPE